MKNIITNGEAWIAVLAALVMLLGDLPEANAATFAAVKICGGALLWVAYKAMERVHPEWEEEEV